MQMYHPPHPGEVLKGLYLEPLNLTITQLSAAIGVERKAISRLVNGHTGISAEMAMRLARAFNTTPELWMNQQESYDLWQAKKSLKQQLDKIKPLVQSVAY